MISGSVLAWKYHPGGPWLIDLVGKVIVEAQQADGIQEEDQLTHEASLLIDDLANVRIYESTVWTDADGKWRNGAKRHVFPAGTSIEAIKALLDFDVLYPPLFVAPRRVTDRQIAYAESQVKDGASYNFLLLGFVWFVLHTVRFWRWLGWVPFTSRHYGAYCSVYVNRISASGWTLTPLSDLNWAPPSTVAQSDLLGEPQ